MDDPCTGVASAVRVLSVQTGATKILLVDDEVLVLRAVSRELSRVGFEVVTHEGGFGFIEAVRQHMPDVVLLDVSMPGLAGTSALRALDEIADRYGITTSVFLHSAQAEASLRALVAQTSAAGYITKPCAVSDMAQRIRDHLRAVGRASTG